MTDIASLGGPPASPIRRLRVAVRLRRTATFLRQNPLVAAGAMIVGGFVVVAVLAPLLVTHDPLHQNLTNSLARPGSDHWLGTDQFGRDVLARLLYGARISLLIGIGSVAISLVIGFSAGVVAGFFRGIPEMVIMRAFDVLLALPGVLLAIAVVAALGSGTGNVLLAVAVNGIPQFGRLAHSAALSIRHREYVEASRSIGAHPFDVLVRHVVPNALGPTAVYAALRIATAILMAAGLSFLGLGVQPPTIEWGASLSSSRQYMATAPHLMVASGGALALLVLGFNALGEGLRDLLDTKNR